jgi:hypothetical protein
MRIFEALFKGESTRFGPRTIEKSVENPHFIFCSSLQNLRLGSINFETQAMWETTSPRLIHAGLGKPINEDNMHVDVSVKLTL